MSTEVLREAAALMCERAEAADADDAMWLQDVAPLLEVSDGTYSHAASWHPDVALAVAELLEAVTETGVSEALMRNWLERDRSGIATLAVARAYLGSAS